MEEECREKDADGEKREIGKLAVWSVSSFKPGNGVDLLRDSNVETYWQSDGAQPHLVNIQFQKKVRLQQLAMYVDFKLDESYTPNKVSVRAGNSFHDLREIKLVELAEPIGWVHIPLGPSDSSKEFLRAFLVQVAVLSNHQNGRDTHIRQITIYGPRQLRAWQDLLKAKAFVKNKGLSTQRNTVIGHPFQFTTVEFSSRSTVR